MSGKNLIKSFGINKKIYLIIVKTPNHKRLKKEMLKKLINNLKLNGMYICLNKPVINIAQELKNIYLDNLTFLCSSDNCSKKNKNQILIKGASSLIDISITVNDVLTKGKHKFLVLDSLSNLLMFNDITTTERFTHYLTNRLREGGLYGILMIGKGERSIKLMNLVSYYVDEVIEI